MGGHVALVLAGRAYGASLPVLRYPAAALAQCGAEVRVVEYPDLGGLGGVDDARFHTAVAEAVVGLAAGASRVTLIGKSLGTAVMALLPDGVPSAPTDAVWLTPIFGYGAVAAGANRKRWPSLFVYGTADVAHDRTAQEAVTRTTGGVEVPIEGGDHSLEVAGDVLATVAGVQRYTAAVLDFARANWRV